jgi:lipoate-protein ligase A
MEEVQLRKYDLPDMDLFEHANSEIVKVWIPDFACIVLGQSNTLENALHSEVVLLDGIPVYKRPSGGQTVVLTPKTIIISVITITNSFNNPQYYFQLINQKIIHALDKFGIKNLLYKGISDIAIGEKKILGSSIYRRKEKLLYHAVLNVGESSETFEKYLKHPVKEPDYRQGRKHSDFVTSLREQGCNVDMKEIVEGIKYSLNAR